MENIEFEQGDSPSLSSSPPSSPEVSFFVLFVEEEEELTSFFRVFFGEKGRLSFERSLFLIPNPPCQANKQQSSDSKIKIKNDLFGVFRPEVKI